jgi:hypothetical protein
MRSRVAAIITGLALIVGTGGAIALGESGSASSVHGGAANGQYKPGKTCTKKNKHGKKIKVPCPKPKPKPKPQPKPKPKHQGKPHKKAYHCTTHTIGKNIITKCRYY